MSFSGDEKIFLIYIFFGNTKMNLTHFSVLQMGEFEE